MLHNATANGQVHLANAQVDGMFALAGSFDGQGEPAVEAYGATLRQGVFLIRSFSAKGPVVFNKAQINDRAVLAGRFEAAGRPSASTEPTSTATWTYRMPTSPGKSD